MPSLVDKLRKDPPRDVVIHVFALDPGLDLVGWAHLMAIGTAPLVSPLAFTNVTMGLLRCAGHKGIKPMEQVQQTIEGIERALGSYISSSEVVAVEGQQLYYKDEETREEVVAKGNDLLRLAQVTGAVQALAVGHRRPHVLSYLPAAWKQQRRKLPMHLEYAAMLGEQPVTVVDCTPKPGLSPVTSVLPRLDVEALPKMMHHGLDALCLAMTAADHLFREGKL